MTPFAMSIPTSFEAPDGFILRRLNLALSIEAPVDALVLWMYPRTTLQSRTRQVAVFEVDVAKAVTALFPTLPDVLTAKVHGEVTTTSVEPLISASGELRSACSWKVSDSESAYTLQPQTVIGVWPDGDLVLAATLHVEVRKRIHGIFHKTYGKDAKPRRYALERSPGGLVPTGWGRRHGPSSAPGVLSVGALVDDMGTALSAMTPEQRAALQREIDRHATE